MLIHGTNSLNVFVISRPISMKLGVYRIRDWPHHSLYKNHDLWLTLTYFKVKFSLIGFSVGKGVSNVFFFLFFFFFQNLLRL